MGHPPRLTGTALACLFLFFAVTESARKYPLTFRPFEMYDHTHTHATHIHIYSFLENFFFSLSIILLEEKKFKNKLMENNDYVILYDRNF